MGSNMLRTIRQFFTPPVFPNDGDKTNAARVLYTFLAWMLAIIGLEIIVMLLFATPKASATFGLVITAFLTLASYALARRGRVRLASALFVFGVWSISTLFVLFIGRLPISFASIQVANAIIAALLLGRRPAIIVAVLSITVGLGLAILEITGASPINYFPTPPTISWFGWAFSFVLVLPALNLTLQSSAQTLARARQSEARLHGIITSAMDAIITIDEAQCIILTNDAATRLFGYPASELLGQPLEKLLPVHFRVAHAQHIHQFGATGVTERAMQGVSQVIGLRANGQEFPIEASISQVATETGKLYTVILRDISERKQAEEELRFRAELLNAVGQSIIATNTKEKIIYINRAAENLYGWSQAETLGKNIIDLAVPKISQYEAQQIMTRLSEGNSWSGEFIVQRSDGTTFPAMVYDAPIFNQEGKIAGIIGISDDITERKQMEEALRASEARLQLVMENSYDGINLLDLQTGKYVLLNSSQVKMTGFEAHELERMTDEEATDRVHPADREISSEQKRRLANGEAAPFTTEYRWKVKSGEYRWFSDTRSVVRDAQGQPVALVGISRDITDRKQAELDLLQANKALMGLHETLREQATRDALTGLFNRRYLYESIERELARARREGYPVSVVMIDIDHFKAFNDRHGHLAGDEFLIVLGKLLLESIRQGDLACRYGGEEFILVLPGAQLEDAMRRAETICQAFQNRSIEFNGSRLTATVSVGIALYPNHGENTNHIIMAADMALYQAKEAGRNCIRLAQNIES